MFMLNAPTAEKIVIPLAAICQSATLVNDIATRGKLDWDVAEPLLHSVLVLDAPDIETIYGGLAHLKLGLLALADQLNVKSRVREIQVSRYLAGLFAIERQLGKHHDLQDIIRTRVQQSARLRQHMPEENNALVVSLAGIYTDTISGLPQRIQVRGEAQHLQNKENQHRIRALLLAGVRNAVLWRQLGGRRRHFLLSRQTLLAAVQQHLSNIKNQ